jgi:hypothetical protein
VVTKTASSGPALTGVGGLGLGVRPLVGMDTVVDVTGTPSVDAQGVWRRGGVPEFMPPEGFLAGRHPQGSIDSPADVYGLGEILFYLLAGHGAFEGAASLAELAVAKMDPPALRDRAADATQPTARLVAALLHPHPGSRPNAAEVRDQALRIASRLAG